jgi:hypothetical protein
MLCVYSDLKRVLYYWFAAIDNEQWGMSHDGFDFLTADAIPPPGQTPQRKGHGNTTTADASGLQLQDRAQSSQGMRPGTGSRPRNSGSGSPARAKSPERPMFAFRAMQSSACLNGTIPGGDPEAKARDEELAGFGGPLSPSPFLQSKYVAGVFVVATKEGQKMIVRGPHIVGPIWFVESGDVYLDWSDLPGGEKLQANLNVLYEHRRFAEFVQLVKQTLMECYYELTNTELEPIPMRANTISSPTRVSVTKNLVTRTNSPPRELSRYTNRFRTRYLEAGATMNVSTSQRCSRFANDEVIL